MLAVFPRVLRYVAGVLSVLAAICLRWVLDPTLGDYAVFPTLLVALAFTAWYCGRGPSIVALGVGLAAGPFLFYAPHADTAFHGPRGGAVLALNAVSGIVLVSFVLAVSREHARTAEANSRLEVEVAQRKRAEEAAAAANQAKSLFLAGMSHEIRTPMTAILGFCDLLLQPDVSDDERRDYLRIIQENGKTLLELINDILDLSKIEAGEQSVERADCSPWRVVDEVLTVAELRAGQKNLALHADYQYPLPESVRTDPTRLRQILLNLVGNAIKFTQQGSVRVEVAFRAGPPPRLAFAVGDTGVGIAPDDIAKLFRPFSQVDPSLSRRHGGTGLGLAISKRLAQMLGGDIAVSSRLGSGSTFTVSIDPGALHGVAMVDRPPQSGQSPRVWLTGERLEGHVLVAEDTRANRHLVRCLLEKAGLRVDFAENGRSAIEKVLASAACGRPYDLILMDIQMPELDGYSATRMLRAAGWKGPIVALTAHAMADDRGKCLEAGCDAYLSKPIRRESLLNEVHRALASPGRYATCELPERAGR